MNANFLDGFLSHGMIVFGDPHKSGYVSCGFSVEAPVLENASLDFLNQNEAEILALLRMLKPGTRMQVSWALDANSCSGALLKYYDQTNAGDLNAFAKRERSERFLRFSKRMDAGDLRFQRVVIYVSWPFSGKGDFKQILKSESQGFDVMEGNILGCFERLGGLVTRLNVDALFTEMFRYCNPSRNQIEDIRSLYDPTMSLMANCLTSEGNAVVGTDAGFFMDGRFFGFLVLKSLPQATYSGILQQITSMPIHDFGITANLIPLDTIREIEKEESEIEKLQKGIQNGAQQRAVTTLNQKIQRVQLLASNEEVPFRVQMIIRAWDTTQEGLQTKLGILKSAITRMQLAKSYAPVFPTSARNYFRASFPGWCWDSCQDYFHLVEDAPLSNLLPISGSPALGDCEALYDGANGNVIGVNSFLGEGGNEAPQHALVCGKSGSGKSCFVIDLLTQTTPKCSFTVIVDNGLSYQTYARTVDPKCETLIIKPNGSVTLNYLDLRHEPLSPEHLVDAVAVAHQMAGRQQDKDSDRMHHAVLSRCMNQFYHDYAQDWLLVDTNRFNEVGRYAVVLRKTEDQKLSLIDRHRRFNLWAVDHAQQAEEIFDNVSEDEIQRVSAEIIQCLSCAFMRADEAPTHSQFQQWLELESMGDASDREEVGILATLLKPWCAEGGLYGGIFDGINNVNFKGEIVHLELGQIPDAAPDLRSLTALVITNQIRNEILKRPRSQRKRVVFEEIGSFLSMPGGGEIVSEFYQTMRKYNCWVISVFQQLQHLKDCGPSLLGNIRLALLLKQSSSQEVELLANAFDLPESASEALMRFPEPSRERGAPFLCWRNNSARPEIVTGFHVASPEMLFVSSSSGGHFEKRQAALSQYDDVLTGIIAETKKIS